MSNSVAHRHRLLDPKIIYACLLAHVFQPCLITAGGAISSCFGPQDARLYKIVRSPVERY